ncbi:AMP nucleosidase [Azospirillum sp. RWY-5-1]|uniref:AMP nucleosidase n=1 Tax=Azospirillum oleiclasticum TaxID=2735135 RepID=A0ABX2TJX8_9PROT|nr:AMP nucleosidase [Azospirillum oleiclasticum]NYZ15875.1 AMP nucleosidase [Azospirillum oleiclasticum]NYZ23646.1 AMP nucleosidase [Azospirillum oleiclasticum]
MRPNPTAPLPPGPVGSFDSADDALEAVRRIHDHNTAFLRGRFQAYARGEEADARSGAHYPYVSLTTESGAAVDSRLAYGFVEGPGRYATSLTRPDLFDRYYREQLSLLIRNHGIPLEVGVSAETIPIHFAFPRGMHVEGDLTPERLARLPDLFDLPDLARMDDTIVNGTFEAADGVPKPLALFTAPRVDFSLHRLRHYTATDPDDFQNFVLFTNYQFYVDEFIRLAHDIMEPTDDAELADYRRQYDRFVEPWDIVTHNRNLPGAPDPADATLTRRLRLPQMPAYHLTRPDGNGISLVNIGVGPSNAKTITDHIAVLRPHAWIMLGHCAGLRSTQRLGDYVLAHGYVRDDHVLDADLPTWVPVPALAEVQQALETAVGRVTGLTGYARKSVMRTGTVATIDNRNWELRDHREPLERFSQSRAIALDMESATIAANGFRFRVPYGTLLCVSDKPMHGQLKLPGMADRFYRERVDQHLKIGLLAMELLREQGMETLHSRKLRSFAEAAFQ